MTSSAAEFDYKAFLKTAPSSPGVYDMRNQAGETLYIGKAKNLKNRLASYFRGSGLSTKTIALISKVVDIQLIVTNSETEALLLEQNLIKSRKPPYNILLRDDKSYPYIYVTSDQEWPRLASHRGKRKGRGQYFGPYPSSGAVKESLNLLQKVFKVRQCDDSYFRNRSRPCLQYQIKRCKAPCVGLVSKDEYRRDVLDSLQFLEGKSQELITSLVERMEKEAALFQFEQAADIRDQISDLRKVIEQQSVTCSEGNADIIGYAEQSGNICFNVLFVRGGQVIGSKCYFPKFRLDGTQSDYLGDFMAQFYINLSHSRDYPEEIIIPSAIAELDALSSAIIQLSGKKVNIKPRVRGERLRWLKLASKNAMQSLKTALTDNTRLHKRMKSLAEMLSLATAPQRIECFDISHTMGEATVASCVVFGPEGPLKSDYRQFNIKDVVSGDDYGAMRAALAKRYSCLSNSSSDAGRPRPDLVLIDGGKGQLSTATDIMASLGLSDIPLLGVAKGVTRKPGMETLFYQMQELSIDGYEAALLLIQQVRDEAHRFAITGHRQRRQKARNRSTLEDIPGVGNKRRSLLLKYFGGRQGILSATTAELATVPGISNRLAQQIYDFLHDD